MEETLFEKAPVHKAYLKLALPVVLSMVVSLVYNMVDTYFIAQTGNTNLVAGVALGTPVFTFMIAVGDIFGLGGSSVISRLFGQKNYEDGKRLSVFCFYSAIASGLLITLIMLLMQEPILHMLGADSETLQYASQYYRYIVLGAPAIILTFGPSNILRSEGLAKESMIGTILGAVINMILDPIFIFGLDMGAAGAAIATVLANVCVDIYYIWVLLNKSKRLSIMPAGFHISLRETGQIFAIGIPASITNLMQSVGITMVNRCLLPYGNDKLATMGIVLKINMIAVLILVGIAFGGQPLIGYNYGNQNHKRLKQILKFAYSLECGLALVLSVILGVIAPHMIAVFMSEPEIVVVGTTMLRYQVSSMIFVGMILISTCTFQSTGKAMGAFILSASRQGVILALVLLAASKWGGYQGVICAQPIADGLTAIIGIVLMFALVAKELKTEGSSMEA